MAKKLTGLVMNNSLTRTKVEFVPQNSNKIYWYACGPTVYDASHMGHARTYVSFDIIRRILTDYFNYDVRMVINITDIDDKIIKRSVEEGVSFSALARKWELDFWEDMQNLNVLLPTAITRVSEYVQEIIKYIEKIIENGYAYESKGSVYFSIEDFSKASIHHYARMEPSAVKDVSRILEGEGELSLDALGKKHPADFALWKKSKENEPSWDSPWGKGRPGWHIECSTMASKILGEPLDIHSGGIDLRFPHHDNELAQSEAYFNKPQWVNYFLHSGHLHIEGLKMSKSLKNFITIKNMLSNYTCNQIRILFLLNRWDNFMNYKPNGESMNQCVEIEKSFINFLALVETKIRNFNMEKTNLYWEEKDEQMDLLFRVTKKKVHESFLDNFNTPEALLAIQKLVSELNIYLEKDPIQVGFLKEMSSYIKFILGIFGLVYEDDKKKDSQKFDQMLQIIGNFRKNMRIHLQSNAKLIRSILKDKSIEANNSFSESVNQIKENNINMLKQCDSLRDNQLLQLGILIDDRPDNEFVIKLLNENELRQEKEKRQERNDQTKINSIKRENKN